MKLKGKTTIELTDINTGEVTLVEDTNFMTNAYSDMCQPILRNHDTIHNTFSLYSKQIAFNELMGGILLFDTALEENPDNYFPPTNAKMIGHSSDVTYSGSDVTLGSFNNNLYESSSTMRKFVWDFNAEQGNGTIASVCLTTKHGGFIGYGTETSVETGNMLIFGSLAKSLISVQLDDSRSHCSPIFLSFKNDFLLYYSTQSLYSTGILTFHKISLHSNIEDIFNPCPYYDRLDHSSRSKNYVGQSYTNFETFNVDISSEIGKTGYVGYGQDGKYLYIARNTSNSYFWLPNSKIKLVRVNLEDFTYETFEVTNTTGEQCPIFNDSSYAAFSQGYNFGVTEGYMFVPSNGDWKGAASARLYAINLEDNTIVHKVKDKDGNENVIYGRYNYTYFGFNMTVNGNVMYSREDDGVCSRQDATYHPMRCVNAHDFIMKSMATPYFGVTARGTDTNSYYADNAFPTDNPLYYGSVSINNISQATQTLSCQINIVPNVLMTINNLASPVTKTPSQTMRITYTLMKEE